MTSIKGMHEVNIELSALWFKILLIFALKMVINGKDALHKSVKMIHQKPCLYSSANLAAHPSRPDTATIILLSPLPRNPSAILSYNYTDQHNAVRRKVKEQEKPSAAVLALLSLISDMG